MVTGCMMRSAAFAAVLLTCAPACAAYEADAPAAITIVAFGTISLPVRGTLPAPDMASGYSVVHDLDDLRPMSGSSRVGACLNVQFGIQYRLTSSPPSEVPIEIEWSHPPMPHHRGGTVTTQHVAAVASPQTRYAGWMFNERYELLPGRWTMTLRQGPAVVAQQAFDVVDSDCGRPIS